MKIVHRVGIQATPDKIYQALTTDAGLSGWWTRDTTGAGPAGSQIQFRFNQQVLTMEVVELQEDLAVKWRFAGDTPEEWRGTKIWFDLQPDKNQTFVRFTHADWRQRTDFMAHCSIKWAVFLLSLKALLETGRGQPFPDDVHVDHGMGDET